MIFSIDLLNHKIIYTLRVSQRARRLRLTIHSDGALVVTMPRGLSRHFVEQFINKKSQWIITKQDYFKKHPQSQVIRHTKKDFLERKDVALSLAEDRIKYFNDLYKFSVNKITIRNQKTRWGSCSRKGNLNFNFKIVFLPSHLADYIIVHELCHLGEFNHSKRFWNLVVKAVPDYLDLRKELRKNGLALN